MNTSAIYSEDETFASMHEEQMANAFADAMARLETGDALDSILNAFEGAVARELRSLLQVGEVLFSMQHAPLPVRSTERLKKRRAHFLEQIALEQVRQEYESMPVAPAPPVEAVPALNRSGTSRKPSRSSSRLGSTGWWNRLQEGFAAGNLRLAPVIVTLVFALTSVFGLWRVSTASLPGDLTYPIKSWVTMMNLSFAPPNQRETVSRENAATIQEDFAASARRAQERATAGVEAGGVTHQESVFLVFEGFDGRLLKFGDIRVVPSYQPDPTDEARQEMAIDGNLQPGAEVWLTVQILPGQADIVQGVRAEVQSGSVGVSPVSDSATPIACTASRPAGWVNYTVQRGDSLAALGEASGASQRAIAGANCLDSDAIFVGQMLFLPSQP